MFYSANLSVAFSLRPLRLKTINRREIQEFSQRTAEKIRLII